MASVWGELKRRNVVKVAVAYAIVGWLVVQFVLVDDTSTSLVGTGDRRSLAVPPLDKLSPDPENALFADGIHGDLLTQLSKIRSLKVISRTSVLEYPDSPKNMREMAISNILIKR